MSEEVRKILLAAMQAGRNADQLSLPITQAITRGDRDLTIDRLGFDSLAWMEFCISVELQSGQELTPLDIEAMDHVFQIEEWLRARL